MQPCCTDGIKCRVFVTTFVWAAQQWFNQLPPAVIRSFQEFRSLFLHRFASSRKHRKTELSLFSIRQKEGEPLKEYLQRFNTAALEVLSATQEVKASSFAQGLLDGDFFKSLAKKPATKFDALLARSTKYINIEDAQASKREGKGEKKRRTKMKALMTVEGKALLSRPRLYKDGPQRPKSHKLCRFHNDYGHTTEEYRHLKNEIERLIQNGYLQEYICWEKARGTGPYQRYEDKVGKNASPESPIKEMPGSSINGKAKVSDPFRKGVIRMIAGGPAGGDSQKARKV
ncbi:UNVERIFIED_CONTAM: hypothetical protein Slati_1103400 [Sesamum latifolium]|uniref:Retrotransposon gag domain-containing protein n=1 Tax=Sesamum latifolium TaxID=2727402 RepID=A0AAW2XBU7_9LAMI